MRHAEVIAKPVAVNPKRGIRGIKVQHFRQFTRYDVFAGDLVELRGIRNRLKPLRDVFDREMNSRPRPVAIWIADRNNIGLVRGKKQGFAIVNLDPSLSGSLCSQRVTSDLGGAFAFWHTEQLPTFGQSGKLQIGAELHVVRGRQIVLHAAFLHLHSEQVVGQRFEFELDFACRHAVLLRLISLGVLEWRSSLRTALFPRTPLARARWSAWPACWGRSRRCPSGR